VYLRQLGVHHTDVRFFNGVCLASAITVAGLALSGCAVRGTGLCAAAGGTYEGGTCVGPGASEATDAACDRRGGIYLPGQNYCAFRGGGQ